MPYNPNKELLRLAEQNPRLLFYPSSGINRQRFFDEDYDVFVFVDNVTNWEQNKDLHSECRKKFWQKFKSNLPPNIVLVGSTNLARVFRLGDKWGFLFFQDNNEALLRIMMTVNYISKFIGICDGCAEGGNYECVNDANFFKKILFLMNPKGMTYLTDHSNLLTNKEIIIGNKHLLKIPTSTYIKYEISTRETTIHLWQGDSITLTLEHDFIANHIYEIDGALVSKHCKELCTETTVLYLGDKIDCCVNVPFNPCRGKKHVWTTGDSLKLLLSLCKKHKWNVVGTTAFGEGNHSEFFDILNAWKGSHPKRIRIFYLDDDDFNDLKFEMKQIDSIHEIKDVRHKTDVHPRAIIVMYCLEALKTFTDMPIKAIARLVMEAATLVQSGLDVNNHDKKYKLKTLLDTYSGLNVICLLHTALQQIAPSKDSEFDIQVEYEKALVLFEGYKQYVYEL